MKKTCAASGKAFEVTDTDLAFYEKMEVPAPTLCPEEVLKSMMSLRNEWNLFPRKCNKTGKKILSAYTADVPFPVYSNEIWWGDSWDGVDYGIEANLTKPFFSQLKQLQNTVPREGTSVFQCENCDYNSHVRNSRNCYLNSLMNKCEDVHYSYWMGNARDCMDCVMAMHSELCYECVDAEGCYSCIKCQDVANCSECAFSFQLRGCKNCIGCYNLTNKQYYVFNKKASKEEYEALHKKIFSGNRTTWEQGLQFFQEMYAKAEHRCVHNLNTENVLGDHIYRSKNCYHCFDGNDSEDCAYSISIDHDKDVYHCYSAGWPGCELLHMCAVSRGCTNLRFCYYSWFSHDLTYCDSCVSCKDCFGCIGLRHKQYCILNKQYTKEAYFALRDKLIEHMKTTGEWGQFPTELLTTFAYNDSVAGDFYPLEKVQAEARGYRWRDEDQKEYQPQEITVPESISNVLDDICDEIFACEITGKNFKIQKAELAFYRKMGLPIPCKHPDQRHKERMNLRNPRQLYKRKCAVSGKEILTTYAPDKPEKVLCEEEYLKVVS